MQFFDDKNFSWGVLAVESTVIMLSVFLGFMLNSWRISQSEETKVNTAMRSIAAEMQYNKKEMEAHLPYYRMMRDTLRYLASEKGWDTAIGQNLDEIPDISYNIPILRASAFETARSTEALSNIDFELANTLFAYYRIQKLYTDLLGKLTDGFIMNNYKTIEDWQRVFTLMAQNGDYVHVGRFNQVHNGLVQKYKLDDIEVDSLNSARRDTAR